MDFLREAVQLIFLLLLFYIPGDCYSIKCAGELTVDKDIIPMGSNLTVRCQSNTVQCNRPFIIQLDEQIILHEISCSNVTARLVVREPEFTLYCMVVQEGKRHLVCARNIVAEGMLPLSITSLVTVTTLRIKVLKKHRRTTLDFLKNIYMDDSLKNLLTKNVKEPPLIAFAKGSLSPTIHWQSSDNMTLLKPRVRFRKTDGAFTPEDYKGDLLGYELVYKENGVTHTLSCSVAASQYTLQLPLEVTEVNVSAVTSAGSSPPAPVRLIYTGKPAPTIYLSQAAGGRIHLNWNSSLPSYSNTPDQTLGFVVEWKCSSIEMQWKRIANDQKSTMLYHSQFSLLFATMYFSLYVESTEGVSDPAFGQIHVKDENVMLIGISLMTAIPIIIILNLLYLKCARQRLRKTCMSVGPSWLFENLPKLGNSNAIKLLYWPKPVDSDPPLSPVEDFSPPVEIKDVYPIVHKDDTTEERKAAQDWASCPYKPQISIVSQRIEAVSEVAESEEDENPWLVFSPGFNKFDDEFLPSQEIHGPLKSCLTVDGTPISVDVVDGLIVLTRATLEEEIWRAEGDGAFEAETGNCDENSHKGQTVLPSDLVNCLKDPSFSVRPHSPQRASTFITSSGVKPCFILSINFCEML
uniref:Interleukin 23 receptor n=1 Tax=Pygocentrus nattereri TaxID=42514 RepID=A0AAR2L508_PYGNA